MVAPALEPVEYRILEDLRTTLQAISTAHPDVEFYTDVASVHVLDESPDQAPALELPAIIVVANSLEAHYSEMIGTRAKLMHFDVYCAIVRQPNTSWIRDIFRFASDVERAVMVDAKRGMTADQNPNAFDTLFTESTVANLLEGNQVAMARVSIAVDFRSSVNDPTQQA